MRILFLAPQPWFEERGTPIAVDLMLKALSERGDDVDLVTFHVGEDRCHRGVTVIRSRPPLAPVSIRPGFSWAKAWCDLFLFREAQRMLRKKHYHIVHAVEEASFIAMALGWLYHVPYVFDMDSSMAMQLIAQYPWLRPAGGLLRRIEALPMRHALAVVPMCDDLAAQARTRSNAIVHVLKDVSLISPGRVEPSEDLRRDRGIGGEILMYVGNLERYQGIDLLLESFARLHRLRPDAELVIIGGSDEHIRHYREAARAAGLGEVVHLLGRRPVSALGSYLLQADVLVSPRTEGTNTPMKIYSYLDSGVPVVATNLPTHSQVMTGNEATLVEPEPEAMAAAMARLLADPLERARLARNAQNLVRREHSWSAFRHDVNELFGELEARLAPLEKKRCV